MTNFYGLPLEFQKIHEKCSYNTFFLVGVSHSGLPRTDPYSNRIENCTQGTPDVKSSGLNHSATLPPFTANYEARVNAPRASSLIVEPCSCTKARVKIHERFPLIYRGASSWNFVNYNEKEAYAILNYQCPFL